jgi:DNA-directed RNA polymerase subunit beta'
LLEKKKNKKLLYFQSVYDVIKAYDQNKIGIHTEIWIKWKKKIFPNYESIYPNELQIYENKSFSYNYSDLELFYNSYGYQINQFIKTTVGRIIFNSFIKIL